MISTNLSHGYCADEFHGFNKRNQFDSTIRPYSGCHDLDCKSVINRNDVTISTTTALTQPTLPSSLRAKLPQNSTHAKAMTSTTGIFVASDMWPHSVEENPGLKHLISKHEPHYKISSRSHLTTKVLPPCVIMWRKVVGGLSRFSVFNDRLLDSWIWQREYQECAKLWSGQEEAAVKNIQHKTYSGLCNTYLFAT